MIPRCFWDLHWETLSLLKTKGGCGIFFNFRLEITSWVRLLRSLFSSFDEVFMSCTRLKRDVSSENKFALEDKSPNKSFSYINWEQQLSLNATLRNACVDFFPCPILTVRNNSLFSVTKNVKGLSKALEIFFIKWLKDFMCNFSFHFSHSDGSKPVIKVSLNIISNGL